MSNNTGYNALHGRDSRMWVAITHGILSRDQAQERNISWQLGERTNEHHGSQSERVSSIIFAPY